jgi:hypothetical protein
MLRPRLTVGVLGRRPLWMGGAAIVTAFTLPCWAQQATTLNGAPVQLQPYVSEPGVPQVTVNVGTPNPFGALDGGDGSSSESGSGTVSGGSASAGNSDALTTMLGTSWGARAAANAQALGVNPSALAATCVIESGCQNVAGSGSVAGAFQMTATTYNAMLQQAVAQDPSLVSQAVSGQAGQMDPASESIAASEYLLQGAQYLGSYGVANPTVVDVRGYYNFGPAGGAAIATASPDATMASVLSMYPASTLTANGITAGQTVGQWQAAVAAQIGTAANQTVLM